LSTAHPGGRVEPAARRGDRRSWPFAAVLVLFVVVLGGLPHLRFSLLVGEAACFFGAYDEPAYALWAFAGGGPFLPHRFLSSSVLAGLSWLVGGHWGWALVLADLVLPALCALLVFHLTGSFTSRRLLRLALGVALLFAQELFSLGCWTIWRLQDPLGVPQPDAAAYDLRGLRASLPEWAAALWPDYASPYLMLFRTPDPQVSFVLLFGPVILLLGFCRKPGAMPARTAFAAAAAINLALFASYFFVASAIVALEGSLAIALFVSRRRALALRIALLAAIGGLAAVAGVAAFHTGTSQAYSFASRAPVLTPATVAAALGLGILLWRRARADGGGSLLPLAAACFACVLALTNQQLITGRMISTRDWERSVDYPLIVLGAMLLARGLVRPGWLGSDLLHATAGAFLVAAVTLLVQAQDRLFEDEFLLANLKSAALERAVQSAAARGHSELLLLQEPELDLALEARLGHRLPHLLDLTPVFEEPIEPLAVTDGRWGVRSAYARNAFEYFARMARTPGAVERLLRAEVGGGTFLRFFFDPRDFWTTITDGRRARLAEVSAQIPAIRAAYEAYLERGDPCWLRPVVILTRQGSAERANPRWRERLLVEATVGRDRPLMNMHGYLQEPAPEVAARLSGACE
jgi:hypothetical protein